MEGRSNLEDVRESIVACRRCPRLRDYCERVASEKKAAYRHDIYWGRPVPGFGDPRAHVLIVGLAPAAHGANRTGRVFTGDGSGDFLMRALHETGFANQPASRDVRDGLGLIDAYIAAAVRCAPPDNKPTPGEMTACRPHLLAEFNALTQVAVLVALGRIAFDACLSLIAERTALPRPRPTFAHGREYAFPAPTPALVASYHPSRQNTNTGRLTPAMLASVFAAARSLASTRNPT